MLILNELIQRKSNFRCPLINGTNGIISLGANYGLIHSFLVLCDVSVEKDEDDSISLLQSPKGRQFLFQKFHSSEDVFYAMKNRGAFYSTLDCIAVIFSRD